MVLIARRHSARCGKPGCVTRIMDLFFETRIVSRGFFRDLVRPFFDGGPLPVTRIAIAVAAFAVFLVVVRLISMIWALVRLYDFRLTRIGEDLRTEYGLFTRVTATVPLRRVQAITINAGPLHRGSSAPRCAWQRPAAPAASSDRPRTCANGWRR